MELPIIQSIQANPALRYRTVERSLPRCLVILGVWFCSFASPILALSDQELAFNEEPVSNRPPTFLVLSGGGARGAAHVGILKVLEELNVPVDFVVGTSMGSIVGGLYASGLSPADMDRELRKVDWKDAFEDRPSRRRTNFRRKEDDLLPLFDFELGIDSSGFKASKGLISGQKVSFLLRRLTLHTLLVNHFDELRLPFRAVAADLEDGSPVVLEDGSLAQAMRASMAIPGVFTPVEWQGRTLVDGGIANNLPVEVARALGAARIIAIDIATPLGTQKDGDSFFDIFYRTFNVINKRNVTESKTLLGEADLLIVPNLEDITAADFDRVGQAIDLGEAAARAHVDALRRYAVPPQQFQAFLQRQRLPKDAEHQIPIHQMEVSGSERVYVNQISKRIRTQPGTNLSLSTLRDDLERLYQIGEFDRVEFDMRRDAETNQLLIDTHDKSWGPGYLRAGLSFFSNLEGESEFLAIVNFRRTQLNRLGAEWKTLITIGEENLFRTEFFQPLDYRGFWFVKPRFDAFRDEFNNPISATGQIELDSVTGGIDLGIQFKNYAQVSIGVETGRFDLNSQFAGGFEGDRGGVTVDILFDQLDNTYFPRRGGYGSIEYFHALESLNSDQDFEKLAFSFIQAWSHGPNSWIAEVNFGSGLDSDIPILDEFTLGGFANLSGFQPGQLRGDELVYASLAYVRHVGKFRYGASFEAGNIWQSRDAVTLDDVITAGLLLMGRETFIGPLYLGYGQAKGGEESYYLFLGQFF